MISARRAGILAAVFPCVAIAQIAYLQIKVTDGEGAVHSPGARVVRPLAVHVTDDAGRPVSGASVSFQLPDDGPGGLFANGLKTDVALTDGNGNAVCGTLLVSKIGGPFQVRVTAVKQFIRAGMLSKQYVAEAGGAAVPAAGQKKSTSQIRRSHKKAILVVLAIGGAAVGGFAASRTGSVSTASSAPVAPPVLSVSSPSISVGKP